MRSQEFLDIMGSYDFDKARKIASWGNLHGGWEVWMQIEIARHLTEKSDIQIIEREVPYPRHGRDRCDFKISKAYPYQNDNTYIELKCMNPGIANPIADAKQRFENDIHKIERLYSIDYSCFALLAVYGVIGQREGNHEPVIAFKGEGIYLRQYARTHKSVYVLVPGLKVKQIRSDTVWDESKFIEGLFLIAVSVDG